VQFEPKLSTAFAEVGVSATPGPGALAGRRKWPRRRGRLNQDQIWSQVQEELRFQLANEPTTCAATEHFGAGGRRHAPSKSASRASWHRIGSEDRFFRTGSSFVPNIEPTLRLELTPATDPPC